MSADRPGEFISVSASLLISSEVLFSDCPASSEIVLQICFFVFHRASITVICLAQVQKSHTLVSHRICFGSSQHFFNPTLCDEAAGLFSLHFLPCSVEYQICYLHGFKREMWLDSRHRDAGFRRASCVSAKEGPTQQSQGGRSGRLTVQQTPASTG